MGKNGNNSKENRVFPKVFPEAKSYNAFLSEVRADILPLCKRGGGLDVEVQRRADEIMEKLKQTFQMWGIDWLLELH